MYCPNCKQEYDGKFCPECGTKLFEKPAASGVSLNLGDANAISGGLHVSDSHDVHNIQNTSNTTIDNRSSVDNSHTVNNSTVYEAQKTKAEIQQENENLFLKAVQERLSDGPLEQRAMQMIDLVRRSTLAMKGGQGTEFLAQQLLEEVFNAVNSNQVDILQRRLPQLEQMARTTPDANIQFYFHMLQASLKPESASITFLNARTDNYWQLFWVHIAYVKLGQDNNATVLLPRMGGFGAPQGDLALLMAIDNLAEYRRDGQKEYNLIQMQEKLMQAHELGLSEPLSTLWYAVKEAMLDKQNPEEWFRFYVEQTLKELCPVKAPAMPKMPPQMPGMDVPPVPKFNAQNVNLAQMQGFNPLQAAQKMGLGMAGGIDNIGTGIQTKPDGMVPPPFPTNNVSAPPPVNVSPENTGCQEQNQTIQE